MPGTLPMTFGTCRRQELRALPSANGPPGLGLRATNLHMREGEFNFLSFLPVPSREELHREWYRGPLSELHAAWASRVRDDVRPTGVQFSTASPKRELLLRLIERGGGLWPLADPINRCEGPACAAPGTPASILAAMASEAGAWVRHLPDLAVLRVVRPDGSDEVFTLFHDKAYTNVALLMDEQGRREPEKDVMTVMRGQPGSYPNFFFEVAEGDLASFVAEIRGMRSPDDWLAVVARHGVRRADPAIWRVADALNAAQVREDPVGAGLLDLNRYIDPKPAEKPASE